MYSILNGLSGELMIIIFEFVVFLDQELISYRYSSCCCSSCSSLSIFKKAPSFQIP